jgi:tetratricopeptide (TPR) repeat protein
MYGAVSESLEHMTSALQLAERTNDPALRIGIEAALVFAHYAAGDLRGGLALADRALAAATPDPALGRDILGFSPYVFLVAFEGMLLTYVGRLDEAADHFARGIELASAHGEEELFAWAHAWHVVLSARRGDPETASLHARAAVEAAEQWGTALSLAQAYYANGIVELMRGDWPSASAAIQQSLDIVRHRGANRWFEGSLLATLAEAHLGAQNVDRAIDTARTAIDVARRYRTRHWESEAGLTLGRALLAAGHTTGSTEAILQASLALLAETGARSVEPFIRLTLADLADARGDAVTARAERTLAAQLLAEMGATGHLSRLAPS